MTTLDRQTRTKRFSIPPWLNEGPFILALIILVGIGLRQLGISFGLPYLSNFYIKPDETLIVVPGIMFFDTFGDPGGFAYPALLKTVCAIIFQTYFQILRLFHITTTKNILDHFILDPSQYFIVARTISVIAGSLTILMVYKVSQKIFSHGTSLLAALLVAVAPLAVRDSHFAVTDTMLSFLTILCVNSILSYTEAPRERERVFLIMISIFAGLALSTKYSSLLLFPPILLAIIVKQKQFSKESIVQILTVFCLTIFVFIAINPYWVIHYGQAFKDVGGTILAVFNKHSITDVWSIVSRLKQLVSALSEGPGGLIGLLFCCLAFALIRYDTKSFKVIAILAVSLLGFLMPAFLTYPLPYRYMVPALPFIAIFVAKGMTGILILKLNKTLNIFIVIIIGLVISSCFYKSFQMSTLLSKTDTRTLAGDWIKHHVPPSVPIIVLGGPESEPQIFESSSSLGHRIEYVYRLYGKKGGDITSELYRLQLRDKNRQVSGYEIVRNPIRLKEKVTTFCAVIPSYPLPMIHVDQSWKDMVSDKILGEVRFNGFKGGKERFKLDEVDAFFLPFNQLDDVLNPGPTIDILLIRRG